MLTDILKIIAGCSTHNIDESESASVFIWNGKVEEPTFVDPTERAIFNTFLPSTWRRKHIQPPKFSFFLRRRLISTSSVTNIYFVRCPFSCTSLQKKWSERDARSSQFSRFWIWKTFCKIPWEGDQPNAKLLPTQEKIKTQEVQTWTNCYSNPQSLYSSFRTLQTPYTPHGLEYLNIVLPKIA